MMIRRNRGCAIVKDLNGHGVMVQHHNCIHIKTGLYRRTKRNRKKTEDGALQESAIIVAQLRKKTAVQVLKVVFSLAVGINFVFYSRRWPTSDPNPFMRKVADNEIGIRVSRGNKSFDMQSSLASKVLNAGDSRGLVGEGSKDLRIAKATGKPRLVIHIGPPKTGSTSLQADLTSLREYLQKDGFVYLGRVYKPYRNHRSGKTVLNRRPDSPALTALRNVFSTGTKKCHNSTILKDCVDEFRRMLEDFSYQAVQSNFNSTKISTKQYIPRYENEKFHTTPRNFLISDEALLKMWNTLAANQTIETWTALYESLTEVWDVTIIATYRRFFDWLPSAKAQRDKPTMEIRRAEWATPDSAGEALRPLFSFGPNASLEENFVEWRRNHFLSDTVFELMKALQKLDSNKQFHLKIFHMYGRYPLTTTFLCNVLALKASCRESRARDKNRDGETRLNSREESVLRTSIPLGFYDAIGTEAANRGIINTSAWNRHQVAIILQDFDVAVRQRARKLGLKQREIALPLKCPTPKQLHDLFDLSLRLEADYMPKLFNRGLLDQNILFQNMVESKIAYCWIDTDKILSPKENASPIASLWLTYIRKQFA